MPLYGGSGGGGGGLIQLDQTILTPGDTPLSAIEFDLDENSYTRYKLVCEGVRGSVDCDLTLRFGNPTIATTGYRLATQWVNADSGTHSTGVTNTASFLGLGDAIEQSSTADAIESSYIYAADIYLFRSNDDEVSTGVNEVGVSYEAYAYHTATNRHHFDRCIGGLRINNPTKLQLLAWSGQTFQEGTFTLYGVPTA